MKNYLIVFWICILSMVVSNHFMKAINAYPHPVEIVQADGTKIMVRIYGNEHFHYVTDINGYIIAEKKGYWYYSNFASDGRITVGTNRVGKGVPFGASRYVPESVSVLNNVRRTSENLQPVVKYPTTGKIKSLVILVNFKDVKFSLANPQNEFNRILNEHGYADGGSQGSVNDYYRENSNGRFDLQLDVYGPVELSHPMSYYGGNNEYGNDMNPRAMVAEACSLIVEESGVKLRDYDVDGDGILDNVFIYYAGYNEAEGGASESIWPHRAYMNEVTYVDGVRVYGYACSSEYRGASGREKATIGNFCHEFGHVLGFPDFYDTDGSNEGWGNGVYNWSLMCTGSYNNEGRTPPHLTAMERWIAGWIEPKTIVGSGDYELLPIHENTAYMLLSENPNEFFLLENRQQTAWDAYLSGHGMLIYHVDKSYNNAGFYNAAMRWETNTVNSNLSHECFRIVSAYPGAGSNDLASMPFPGSHGNTKFTNISSPSNKIWSGSNISQNLLSIREDGNVVRFKVDAAKTATMKGVVKSRTGKPVANVNVTVSQSGVSGRDVQSVISDNNGAYSIELTPGIYEVSFSRQGWLSEFMTQAIVPGINTCDVILTSEQEKQYNYIGYSNDKYNSAVGMNVSEMEYGILWEACDLDGYVGYGLEQLKFFVKDKCDAHIRIYIEDLQNPVFSKPIDVVPGVFMTADISDGMLSIPAGKKLLVSLALSNIRIGDSPAGVDMGPAIPGKSDLIRQNGEWKSVHNNYGKDFNWLMGLYIKPQSVIPVTSVTLDKSKAEVFIGDTLSLKATVLPNNATDKSVIWHSENSAVVQVSQNGTITGVSAGTAKVFVTTIDGKHSAECVVECKLVQKITGVVKDVKGNPLDGVTVSVSEVRTSSKSKVSSISKLPVENPELSVMTDENGVYEIMGVPVGEYMINFSKEHYASLSKIISVLEGVTKENVSLRTQEEAKSIEMKWHNGQFDGMIGSGGREVVLAVKFDADDLKPYVGYQLSRVDFMLAEPVLKTKVNIYIGDKYAEQVVPAYTKEVTANAGTFTNVDLKDLNIHIPDGKSIMVGYQISGYDIKGHPVAMDNSLSVNGKGNLFMDLIDYRWMSLDEDMEIPGNLLISAFVMPAENMAEVEEIRLNHNNVTLPERESIQLQATIIPDNATNKNVTWKSSDNTVAVVNESGLVTAIKEGIARVSCSTYNGVTAYSEITVTAARETAMTGRIVSEETGEPVKNAIVELRDIVNKGNANSFHAMALSENSRVVQTGADGRFVFDGIFIGEYTLSISAEGYNPKNITVKVDKMDFDAGDIAMEKDVVYGAINLAKHNGEYDNAIGGQGYPFRVASYWSEKELTEYQGYTVDFIRLHLQAEATVDVLVYFGDPRDGAEPVLSKTVTPVPGSFTNVDIRDFDLAIPAHTGLAIGYYVKEYAKDAFPASIDNSGQTRTDGSLMNVAGEWSYLSDVVTGYTGNWILGALLNKAEKVPVETIELSADYDKIYVGDTLRIHALVAPENATNHKLLWKSSSPDIVKIDENGLMEAVTSGNTTITAMSEDGNAQSSIEITSYKGQYIRGTITDHFGNPVQSAVISLSSKKNTSTVSSGIYMAEKYGEDGKTTYTDENGHFEIMDMPAGLGMFTVSKDGYLSYISEVDVNEGVTVLDAVIEQELYAESEELKWHNGSFGQGVGASGNAMTVAAGWSETEMGVYEDYKLLEAKILINAKVEMAEVLVFWDDATEPSIVKQVNPKIGQETVVNFYEDEIFVPEGVAMKIGYRIKGYDRYDYPAAMDASEAEEGKGNLLLIGSEWVTASGISSDFNGNWLISAVLAPRSLMNITVTAGQNSAYVRWDKLQSSEWEVSWKKKGDDEFSKPVKTSKNEFFIDELEEQTEYVVRISSDETSGSVVFETVTIEGKNPGIQLDYIQKSGMEIPLILLNKPENTDKVIWKIDGTALEEPMAVFSPGEHEVSVVIYHNGVVEYVIAYIMAE